ncbi:MAG: hypothetical protein R3E97_21560 [Candidatus Eisenbacteria bacterium]
MGFARVEEALAFLSSFRGATVVSGGASALVVVADADYVEGRFVGERAEAARGRLERVGEGYTVCDSLTLVLVGEGWGPERLDAVAAEARTGRGMVPTARALERGCRCHTVLIRAVWLGNVPGRGLGSSDASGNWRWAGSCSASRLPR